MSNMMFVIGMWTIVLDAAIVFNDVPAGVIVRTEAIAEFEQNFAFENLCIL